MGVGRVEDQERAEAIASAIDLGQAVIREGAGFVHPNARLGSLSPGEWRRITEAIIAGWIQARSGQLIRERFREEDFLSIGSVPEPHDLATCSFVLPALGELIAHMGLTDVPIGRWDKQDVLLFVWSATEQVNSARTARDERPGPAAVLPEPMTG
jgi:hypothetical protein